MRSVGSDLERWGCLEHILEVSLLGVFHWSLLPPKSPPRVLYPGSNPTSRPVGCHTGASLPLPALGSTGSEEVLSFVLKRGCCTSQGRRLGPFTPAPAPPQTICPVNGCLGDIDSLGLQ